MNKTDLLPCLPLRDIVVFPGMIIPLFVGRDKSIKALNEVMKSNKKIILVTQKNAEIDDPTEEDLYSFGCESKILQLLKLPDGTVKVLVEGINLVKRHTKATGTVSQAGIIEKELPIRVSNVMLICTHCNEPSKLARKILDDGTKARVCKKCKEVIE